MIQGGTTDSEELAAFREQWKVEVKQRKKIHEQTRDLTTVSASSTSLRPLDDLPTIADPEERPTSNSLLEVDACIHMHGRLAAAVDSYQRAVEQEQSGDLDGALRLYRHAFSLDLNVDRAYQREQRRALSLPLSDASLQTKKKLNMSPTTPMKMIANVKAAHNGDLRVDILDKLLATFPPDLQFMPENDRASMPFRLLPDELIIHVLRALEPTTIETFAVVSRKARLLSLDTSIWRSLVRRTYIHPQIPEDKTADDFMGTYCSWRHLFIAQPRIRLDGVYIAVRHYVRRGLSENPWVQITHLITYHRYLRFFPDGTVISLLATEELNPKEAIPLLLPTLRKKGVLIGKWALLAPTPTVRIYDLVEPDNLRPRYSYRMRLTILSRPLGRWNKLELGRYESVHMTSGEVIPFPLKHERPFWFSKVRSYN